METVLTKLAVSMSEFKKNPSKVVREAGNTPVAVLNHNKPAFYMIDPETFEAMLEKLADIDLLPVLQERLSRKHEAVEVKLDEL